MKSRACRISILTPVCDPREQDLRMMLESVLAQSYPYWELCIADDASTCPHVLKTLQEYSSRDKRIKVVYRPERGHIAAASNTALQLAAGDFVALVDHDDWLEPEALDKAARCIARRTGVDMIYTDERIILPDGRFGAVHHKPAWSPDLFLSNMYTCHLGIYRRRLVESVGGFRIGFEGSQDHDLVLRLAEKAREICHLPEALYHWRCSPTSAATDRRNKMYAFEAGKRALEEALRRRGEQARVVMAPDCPGHYEIHFAPSARSCSIFLTSEPGPQLETWLSANSGLIADVWQPRPGEKALPSRKVLAKARGEVFLFWNPELAPGDGECLAELTGWAARPGTGAVSGLWKDGLGRIIHAGVLFGIGNAWDYSHRQVDGGGAGYFGRLVGCANYLAVGQDFLAVSRRKFERIKGFDDQMEGVCGLDLCLKLHSAGYLNVVVPWIRLYGTLLRAEHIETGYGMSALRAKWGNELLEHDPFYHPALSRDLPFEPLDGAKRSVRCRCSQVTGS